MSFKNFFRILASFLFWENFNFATYFLCEGFGKKIREGLEIDVTVIAVGPPGVSLFVPKVFIINFLIFNYATLVSLFVPKV